MNIIYAEIKMYGSIDKIQVLHISLMKIRKFHSNNANLKNDNGLHAFRLNSTMINLKYVTF